MSFKVYAFDAYGTLFDVHSAVARHRALVGAQAERLSELWRAKQLEYTWTRSLMGAYFDFEALTAQALDFSAARCGGISMEAREALLCAYQTLSAFDDVAPALERLTAQGKRCVIFSNGSPRMLEAAVRASGLSAFLDPSISVHSARVFKTSPQTYAMVCARYQCAPADISFQSSNRWDIAGAKAFGFRCVWINRTNAPDEYADLPPDVRLQSLQGLPEA